MKQEQGISYGQPNESQASQMSIAHGKDKHTSRNPALAALVVPLLIAACNSTGAAPESPIVIGVGGETPAPIVTPGTMPSQTESPTISVSPSVKPAETAKPTPEATPTPKPTETPAPFVLETFLKGKHAVVSADTMTKSVNKAVTQNPNGLEYPKYLSSGNLKQDLAVCNGTNVPAGDVGKFYIIDKFARCESLASQILGAYTLSGDANYLTAFKNIYNYTISPKGVGKTYKAELDGYLTKFG